MRLGLAVRQLLKTPGFTITALATLAICLGANLTIFSVVDAIVLRSLPLPAADRLVLLSNSYPGAGADRAGTSIANYFDRRGAIKAFASISIYNESSAIIGDAGSPNRVPIAHVSPEFFSTLGVRLAMGDTFTTAQLAFGPDQVAILTDGFWRTHFNADRSVLGRTFMNDGLAVTVVGVLPRDFHFLSSRAQFYRPAAHDPADRLPSQRHNGNWTMIARLVPGVTLAGAQAQIDAFNVQQAGSDPNADLAKKVGYHTIVVGLHDDYVHSVRPTLVLLQCGVLFLLLIGGVNLANLLLIRTSRRAKELALRLALGAGRRHLAGDVLVETTLLALAGGLSGLATGALGTALLPALGTDQLPLGSSVAFDGRAAAAALLATVVLGCLLAMPTLWFYLRMSLATGLKTESHGGTAGRDAQRLRHGFIVAQVALAFVLLSGAGLLTVSLKHVLDTPTGFDPTNILSGNITLPWKTYRDNASELAFVERLVPAVRALPGVTQVAINTALPFNHATDQSAVAVEGFASRPGAAVGNAIARAHDIIAATSDYWPMMGIRLMHGRMLTDADNHRVPAVCVVDRDFAERYWPGADPLGHRLTLDNPYFDTARAVTIVGVVTSVKQDDLAERSGYGAVYVPYALQANRSFALVVRSTLPATVMAPMVRNAVVRLDGQLPIDDMRPMQSRIDESLVARRSPAILAGIFAVVALLLAAIGTYGVVSYAVSQRQREIGVRMALGARPRHILHQFLSIDLRLLTAGIVLGVIGAQGAGRAMQAILFGVPDLPPSILVGAIVIMAIVSLTACSLPARRATRVDPMTAFRGG